MRKKSLFSIIGILGSSLFLYISVSAEQPDEIHEKNQKIEAIKSQEIAAFKQVESIQKELDEFEKREKELAEENMKLTASIIESDKKINKLNVRIVQRREHLEKQARSVQVNTSGSSIFQTLTESTSPTDFIQRCYAIFSVFAAGNQALSQQKKDVEVVQKERQTSYTRSQQLQKNQLELGQSKKVVEQRKADLQVAQVNLSAERATEEGARNELLAKKAQAEAEAAAVAKRQQEETTNLQQAQAESQGGSPSVVLDSSSMARTFSKRGSVVDGPEMCWIVDHGFYWGQCTWYANKYFGYRVPHHWGNACTWASAARADNVHTVSFTPRVNSIACYQNNCDGAASFGHVAVVIGVNGDGTYNISESNVYGLGVITERHHLSPKPGTEFIYM